MHIYTIIHSVVKYVGFPDASAGKKIHLQCGRPGFDPWVGKIPGEGNSYPLQYSGLENAMDYIQGHNELDTTEQFSPSYIHL